MPEPEKRFYYVEGVGGWFITDARNVRLAKSDGVETLGRGCVSTVRVATADEVRYYISQRGIAATRSDR